MKKNNTGMILGLIAMVIGFIGPILSGYASNKQMEAAIEESINRRLNSKQ